MNKIIIKIINFLLYGLVFLIPLIYFKGGMFPFQVVKTVIFQSLVEIIFALWLALAIFNREFRPKKNILLFALGLFLFLTAFSAILGVDWRNSLWTDESRTLGLVALWHFGALFLAFAGLRDKINWNKIWAISFTAAVLVSFGGIIQKFAEFKTPLHNFLMSFMATGTQGASRVGSTFGNPAFMAGYLLPNFFIGLWIARSVFLKRGKNFLKSKTFWILCVGLIAIALAILFSQTLGVFLGLFSGVIFLIAYQLFYSSSQRYKKLAIGAACFILVFGAIFYFTKDAVLWQEIPGFSKLANLSLQNAAVRDRLVAWGIGLKAFEQKPILGWGFENFRIAFDRNYEPVLLNASVVGTFWDKPHNVLVEHLTNTGILGELSYILIFLSAFYLLIKKIGGEFNGIKPFLIALLIAYFAQNLFLFDTIGTYLMLFLSLSFIGYAANLSAFESKNEGKFVKKINFKVVAGILLAAALAGIFYNYKIFSASRYEYQGANYLLNLLPESSLLSFNKALGVASPYQDDIKKTFANAVKQAYQQGIEYPKLEVLQEKLADNLRNVIIRHPGNYLNYLSLAEFLNVFSKYNLAYLDEAESLTYQALALSPSRQQIYYVLAKTKLLQNDPQGAYNAFEKAVDLNPEAGDPHFYFGLMAYGLGDFVRGRQEIEIAKSLGRAPQKMEEAVALGNFIGDQEHNYKEAIELYKMALTLLPPGVTPDMPQYQNSGKPNICLKLAIAYYFDKDYQNARNMFNELNKMIDIKSLPIYPQLQPVLRELKINY